MPTDRLPAPLPFRRVALVCLALAQAPSASAQSQPAPQKPLQVATRIVPPLVLRGTDGKLTGFSVDLWREIAREAKLPFDFVERTTLPDILSAVKDGGADLAVAAISITSEREETFDFSQPILESGLQILVPDPAELFARDSFFSMLATPALWQVLGWLLLLAAIPVPIIWWLECRHAEGIIDRVSRVGGLGKATWWSMSALVGQSDQMPRSPLGRIVALVWMLVSLLFVSYFTATMTTVLTVRQLSHAIREPTDLPGKTVGTVAGSTAAGYLETLGVRRVDYETFDKAAAELDRGKIDAIVYDAPVLLYYATNTGKGRAQVTGSVFRKEDYGVLLPSGSPLRKPINAALLRLQESGVYRTIHAKWFGRE